MNLTGVFNIKDGDIVSFVGAGGKSTAMWTIAEELSNKGKKVFVTTTTKIFIPHKNQTSKIIMIENDTKFMDIYADTTSGEIITLGKDTKKNKILGIPSSFIEKIKCLNNAVILIEADGASRKPFKAPESFEPVVPQNTKIVIPVIGTEILGQKLLPSNAHRINKIKEITNLKDGDIITPDAVKKVLLSKNAYRREDIALPKARWIPLFNKLDKYNDMEILRNLVKDIFKYFDDQDFKIIGSSFKTKKIIIWDKEEKICSFTEN
jgi:probable selenium-dependent hydroxylase accessory protein YqeC